MRLRELDASFLRIIEPKRYLHQDDIESAQGLFLLCPACFQKNGGKVGTHAVICWFSGRGVSDEEYPRPGRWAPHGTGLDDLTLVSGSSSVLLQGAPCKAHFYVRNGGIEPA